MATDDINADDFFGSHSDAVAAALARDRQREDALRATTDAPQLSYLITFERIGRNKVDPLTVTAPNTEDLATDIARQVFEYARNHLVSREVKVIVKLDKDHPETGGKGSILAGFRSAGMFTLEPAPGDGKG